MTRLLLNLGCVVMFALPGVASAPILYNGGFEIGDFTGWILSGNPIPGSVEASDSHSGTYAARLIAAGSAAYMEQFFATRPGTAYEVTFFLESDGRCPNEFLVQVGGATLFDKRNIPAQSYVKYSFRFEATKEYTSVRFGFRDDPGSLHLDDVSVTTVTEPASAGLGVIPTAFSMVAAGQTL